MAGEYSAPIRLHWALRLRPHPAGAKDWRSGLVQPERVEPDHVVDAEIIFRIVALHVVVPDIEDILPGDRHQRRVLRYDVLGLPNERQALAGVNFDVDLIDEFVELGVVPEGVILRPVGAIPGV